MAKGRNLIVLVATYNLSRIGGTESWCYTIAKELKIRGYDVEYFTISRGITSKKLEEIGINFMSKKKYDLILANHTNVIDRLLNKGVIIQTMHGIFSSLEFPNKYADLFVSISREIQDFNKTKGRDSVFIPNGIDLQRFHNNRPLNEKLTRILSLSHSERANEKLKTACDMLNIELLTINKFKTPIWDIENYINKVDLVIGLGRSAYDAMACGRPIIVYDERDYMNSNADGYINFENIDLSFRFNCSGRGLKKKFTVDDLVEEFLLYNTKTGKDMRSFAENNLDIKKIVDSYLDLYEREKEKHRSVARFLRNSFAKGKARLMLAKYAFSSYLYNKIYTK
ncbi:Glycosyltransferase involved in cell wall bisynthesis [Soonwooa buanensis]|uniref:Glycosyltransferase involved in cell wall bisynthesis n=1 Tax=Soonwooa buanensis TaxID=619805 RepID=A0A1T5FIK7_9FLAO|nr:hypothetical protein [Soonwooa buanensis]SKB95947.1 Glycosyltransferase involved in cell wall bisynthesis [Soonwooa buanensis]